MNYDKVIKKILIKPKEPAFKDSCGDCTSLGDVSSCENRNFQNYSAWLKKKLGTIQEYDKCPLLPPLNCEELRYQYFNYNGSFHKGLEHNGTDGRLISNNQYEKMVESIMNNNQELLQSIQIMNHGKLVNPLASLSIPLIGAPPCLLNIPDFPELSSDLAATELVELYAMVVARDIPFIDWATDAVIAGVMGKIGVGNVGTLFNIGINYGPYISQFLFLDITCGGLVYPQKYLSPPTRAIGQGGWGRVEWGISKGETIDIQNLKFLPLPVYTDHKYIYNGRTLAEAVHNDTAYQFYYQAAIILNNMGIGPNPGIPNFVNQASFITGSAGPSVQCALATVTELALKHAWFWKWQKFRRLRPETMALWVDNILGGQVSNLHNYDISNVVLSNGILADINSINVAWGGSGYCIPLAYREGSPLHSAYPAGHSVIAGAAVTILKIFYDCEQPWTKIPVIADSLGNGLINYSGPDAINMTINGELNKLAYNVSMGRGWAGIHYRTDMIYGLKLGEQIAIEYMNDILSTWVENYENTPPIITFRGFDNKYITISPTICDK